MALELGETPTRYLRNQTSPIMGRIDTLDGLWSYLSRVYFAVI